MSIFDQFSKVTKDFGNKAQEMTKDIKGKLEEQQLENDMANQFQIIADAMEKILSVKQIRDFFLGRNHFKGCAVCLTAEQKSAANQKAVCPEYGAAVDEDDVVFLYQS